MTEIFTLTLTLITTNPESLTLNFYFLGFRVRLYILNM